MALAVHTPGVVTPFFQPYDDAIEAQDALAREADAEREAGASEVEPAPETGTGDEEFLQGEPVHSVP